MTKFLLIASTAMLLTAALVFNIKEQRLNAEIRNAAEVNAELLKELKTLRQRAEMEGSLTAEFDALKQELVKRGEAEDSLRKILTAQAEEIKVLNREREACHDQVQSTSSPYGTAPLLPSEVQNETV